MPRTTIRIYREADGQVPLIEWLDHVPARARDKCIARVELLAELGNALRRPVCDYIEQGIYELRAKAGNVNYRILYAFVGKNIVMLSHGCTKEKNVPKSQIERAMKNRANYARNPRVHTYEGDI